MPNVWAILGTAVTGLLFVLVQWMKSAQDRSLGGQLEAGKVATVTAVTETAVAQAEAAAPTTQLAVVDRLKAGTF